MKPKCPTCNGVRMIVIQEYDSKSLCGFQTFAVPCPECQSSPVYDFKLAASGETIQ